MNLLSTVRLNGLLHRIVILANKDNPSSDALLSDNLSNSQGTFVEGWQVRF